MVENAPPTPAEKPEHRLGQPWQFISRVLGSLLLLDGFVVEANAAYNLLAGHLAQAEYYGQGGLIPSVIGAVMLGGSFLRKPAGHHAGES
jgi:hypothetical protein